MLELSDRGSGSNAPGCPRARSCQRAGEASRALAAALAAVLFTCTTGRGSIGPSSAVRSVSTRHVRARFFT